MLRSELHSGTFETKESGAGLVRVPFLEVPLRYLLPSIIYSVPCDWIVQRGYYAFRVGVIL